MEPEQRICALLLERAAGQEYNNLVYGEQTYGEGCVEIGEETEQSQEFEDNVGLSLCSVGFRHRCGGRYDWRSDNPQYFQRRV